MLFYTDYMIYIAYICITICVRARVCLRARVRACVCSGSMPSCVSMVAGPACSDCNGVLLKLTF